jgi:hypothetical protein
VRRAALVLFLAVLASGWLALREPLRVTSARIEQARTLVIPPQVRAAFGAALNPGDRQGRLLLPHTGALRGRMLRRHLTELAVNAIFDVRYRDEELLRAYLDSIYLGRDGKRRSPASARDHFTTSASTFARPRTPTPQRSRRFTSVQARPRPCARSGATASPGR